jgi:hypothetical protein
VFTQGLALRHGLAYFSDILKSLTEPDPSLANGCSRFADH